jgi:WD40 repeat protein
MVVTGGIDHSVRLWDLRANEAVAVYRDHEDEVLHVAFNSTGSMFASASSDGTARVYEVEGCGATSKNLLEGHSGEVSKVLLLASSYSHGGGLV